MILTENLLWRDVLSRRSNQILAFPVGYGESKRRVLYVGDPCFVVLESFANLDWEVVVLVCF